MTHTRRDFLTKATLGLGAAVAAGAEADTPAAAAPEAGVAPTATGPTVSMQSFAEAEKLLRVQLLAHERRQAARSWDANMAPLFERRDGSKPIALGERHVPYSSWDPRIPGRSSGPPHSRYVGSAIAPQPLPTSEADIAFAPVTALSQWIHSGALTSERLTEIYLSRMDRYDPKLKCVINRNPLALERARAMDAELKRGHSRGPLHGIPWGAKDLLDTAGLATTWGAEPFRHRVPTDDATVVRRLEAAGAVLIAKLSLGALALNDVWFGGTTRNPWVTEEGSSGSSAGPGSATAAGLVAFSIGSETGGSIVSPSMRCGVTGLRPTYGRVARGGAMTLCWSLDKLGPMTRTVEDAILVLDTIRGPDSADVQSVPAHLDFDATAPITGLRIGYVPTWMDEAPATDVDRSNLKSLTAMGLIPVPVSIPDWPYAALNTILFAESAAAFEDITLSRAIDTLHEQSDDAWPNTFRQSRFLSAVDYVQADRLRRRVCEAMADIFDRVDVLVVPSLRDEMLTISNHTGHPSLTLRTGFVEISSARSDWAPDPSRPTVHFASPRRVPHGITLIGRLFDEGTIARVGMALERHVDVAKERPPGFT
jgi:Asp-tRNA(Asn)/Glu-tRNA(Gln) amidotransferase A subunit family amidase